MNPDLLQQERIRTLAGEQVFERGLQASASADIEHFVLNKGAVSARIEGFQVSLRGQGDRLEGACSCPESDGFEFCHHCVMLALHAGKSMQQMASLSKGPDKSKIMAYLLSLEHQELARQMLQLVEADPAQFKRYLLKVSLEQGEPDYPALKKELTRLTRAEQQLFSQRQLRHYFSRIERFLEEVAGANFENRPEAMLRLVEYAIARVNLLLDKMEDRGQQRQQTVELLADLYQTLFERLEGRDETRCKRFEKTWLADRHQVLGPSVERYLGSGSALIGLFATRVYGHWQHRSKAAGEIGEARKIARYLLEFGAKEGGLKLSVGQQQALRETLAEQEQDFLQIARLWLQEGEVEQAERVLQGCLQAGFHGAELFKLLARLYGALDLRIDSLVSLFEAYPLQLGESVFEEIIQLEARERFAERVIPSLEHRRDDESKRLLLVACMHAGWIDRALELAHEVDIEYERLEELVRKGQRAHPDLCARLLQQQIEHLLKKGMISADKKAASLMTLLATLQGQQHFDVFVDTLQPLIRKRPKFVESYEQSKANRLT